MNREPLRLLLLAGSPGWASSLQPLLEARGIELLLCQQLEELHPYLASSGSAETLDIIVVDLSIGSLAVQRFDRWLRGHRNRCLVMAVGAQLDEAGRVRLLESWADDVVLQPFSLAEFVARCRALRRRQQFRKDQEFALNPRTLLSYEGLTMLVEEHSVRVFDQTVELSPKEFRLLEFLLRHPGQTLDRQTLLEQVWGECSSFELDPKTVDVHIRWLRSKLEGNPSAPTLITTVRGRGYRLG